MPIELERQYRNCESVFPSLRKEHTVGLFGGRVVIVQLAAQEAQPLLQVEHAVIGEVAGTTLNDQSSLVGKVLRQARSNHATSGTTTDDDIVVAVEVRDREVVGGRHVVYSWRRMRGKRGR